MLPPHTCSAIMDVKIVFLIVCLCALAITSTEAGIPRCCMTANKKIKRYMLKNIQRWEMQEIGACDIRALVVFVKGFKRPLCVDPRLKPYLEELLKEKKSGTKNVLLQMSGYHVSHI
uniref:Chemokine interleukin-8-like domain-containing protein n=1 Tax=Haplochromis burtoni TaxID=8153 RepID=A0A3Q2WD99_HAPBU